jgi:hypothetical protein
VGSVLKVAELLAKTDGTLNISTFREQASLSEKSFYNIAKDMGLLGLVNIDNDKITLKIKLPTEAREREVFLRDYLQGKLRLNRLVWKLTKALEDKGTLSMEEASKLLEDSCPYISAAEQTWLTYARIFAGWMDTTDLAVYDTSAGVLTRYEPGTEIRERHLLLARRRGAMTPLIQYSPVKEVITRLVQAIQKDGRANWDGLSKSTIFKALATLEDLDFIIRKRQSIEVLPKGREFVINPENRPTLFAEGALKMKPFEVFIGILEQHKDTRKTLSQLAGELKVKLGAVWKDGTAKTNTKIMLDWARHTKLAPGVYAGTRKGPRNRLKEEKTQGSLF